MLPFGGFFCLLGLALASTQRSPPLARSALSHPEEISYQILPRTNTARLTRRNYDFEQPAYDDRFILTFTTNGDPVYISLRPATNFIHPNGIKSVETYTNADGVSVSNTKLISREEVRVYEGQVFTGSTEDELERWLNEETAGLVRPINPSNWAKILVVDSPHPSDFRFQGSFSFNDNTYTVHSLKSYLDSKHRFDPVPPLIQKRSILGSYTSQPDMVIVKERDFMSTEQYNSRLKARGLGGLPEIPRSSSCSHDNLPFNVDPSNPVYQDSRDYQVPSDGFFTPWRQNPFGMPLRDITALDGSGEYMHRGIRVRKRQTDIGNSEESSNFFHSIGSTVGCPKTPMVLFMGVAADCTYTNRFNSADEARTQILTEFNSASSLYQSSFNVSLGVVAMDVQTGECPRTSNQLNASTPWNVACQEGGPAGLDLNSRLSAFSQWRGNKGGSDGAGLWHLVTNCSTGEEVGVAWLGTMCQVSSVTNSNGQVTSGTAVSSYTRSIWQVIAHEIGHNFGAIHDCTTGCTSGQQCCSLTTSSCNAGDNFIMSPVSSPNVTSFSQCSIGNICSSLGGSRNTSCLFAPGVAGNPPIISLQACGNGILEAGEECDPGSNGNDPCCDATTCRFINGATCSPRNSLCCSTSCQIASAGTVCRPSLDSKCDKTEVCAGNSAECPQDEHEPDGTSCGNDGLTCATGVCTSRDLQCRTSGSRLNLTTACATKNSVGCSITCQDPRDSGRCLILEQSFRDGSECGYGGRCVNSACAKGSIPEIIKSWYTQNLHIAIPVTVVVALIVLSILWSILKCFGRCCCGKGRQQSKAAPSAQYANGGYYATPMQPMPANGRLQKPRQYSNYGEEPSHEPFISQQDQNGWQQPQHAYPSNAYMPPPGPPPSAYAPPAHPPPAR